MIVVGLLVVTVLVVLFKRRASRKDQRAGLDGGRPVFSIDPPTRRLGSRRRELL